MTETAPRIGKSDEVAHADPKNVRRAAWAGLVGTALEQYDFIIYGTASALDFQQAVLSQHFPRRRHDRGVLRLRHRLPRSPFGRSVLLPLRREVRP